jgi:translation initiation factor IF-3
VIRSSLEGPPAGSAQWGCSGSAIFCLILGTREAGARSAKRGVLSNSGGPQKPQVFWGGYAIARPLRVNDQIRIRSVRVIDENGEQLGILPTEDALSRARTAGLDLIEVSPTAQPPVCKIADYGRLKYEQSKKDKDARKKQRHFELKEVKLRPKIETHDYETKARMAERLLLDGSKIKVTIMFRGREITYTSFGRRLLDRMAEDMTPLATIEREPRLEGRNMFMILAPRATPTGPPKFTQKLEERTSA